MKVKAGLSVLLVLSWTALVWLWVRTSRQDAVVRGLEQQLQLARAKAQPPPAPVVQPSPKPKPAAEPRQEERPAPEPAVDPEAEALRAQLQEATQNTAKLQARVTELESEMLNLTAERARATAAEKEAGAKIADLTRTIDNLNADRPATEHRLRDLEAETARLRDQNAASAQRTAQFDQWLGELRDITRRQQTNVTNILRRYRDVTNIFRSLPGSMDTKGSGPEMMRIQTAMSMADEDVRQLNDLSARLGRLEKRIAK